MRKEFSVSKSSSKTSFLIEAIHFAEESLTRLITDQEKIQKPLLCIEEILTNIVNHSNLRGEGKVILSIDLSPTNELMIEVRDQGDKFDVSKYISHRKQDDIGGVGIKLVRSFMNVEYEQKDGWNIVLLKKKL